MSIDLSKATAISDDYGNIIQLELGGRVIWLAMRKVKVTISSVWDGFDGDSASITITSKMPFAPDPTNPSNKVTTWTYFVYDQPNCTIEVPEGSTIECTVSRDKGNADSYIKLNGLKEVTGEGSYVLTVTRDVTISIEERYSQGDYGVITIVEDGAVIAVPVVLQVEKITSDTYANSTTYKDESFILLSITPKTANSTVKVTYGGLTKTLTFTNTLGLPSPKEVFFGTFNGVSDSVATPASGELTIEGECIAVGIASFNTKKSSTDYCSCITAIHDLGNVTSIPADAFYSCQKITSVTIPESVTTIGAYAFHGCYQIDTFTIPSAVTSIGEKAFYNQLGGYDKTFILKPTVPPTIGADVFYIPESIVVPVGCGEAYKAAEGWSAYADKITEGN